MNKERMGILIIMISLFTGSISSQNISNPNFALKSHETLEILKIEISGEKTFIYFSIENRIEGGSFCADRNIFLTDPGGVKLKMKRSEGIPVCPDLHKFKKVGEKLMFILEFPALPYSVKWVDITEECNDNCFSFYGVVLDRELNLKLDESLVLAEKGDVKSAVASYIKILNSLSKTDLGIKGGLYTDIITLSAGIGDQSTAAEWYKKMVVSDTPRLDLYIRNLNSRGIKY